MNDSKEEEALCNNAQNHRQQLLNHQQEIDRDLEAGSYSGEEEDEETRQEGAEEGEGGEGEGENAEIDPKDAIPVIYQVEPGCTALGCYSAIATFIIMTLGIVALLMYSSPPNARADNLVITESKKISSILVSTLAPDANAQHEQ
ncbi:hypothetical protein SK128_013272 [Halocaridina rubra]|uniref:Uncharacterized protein n=1 Tax=Halocaridina rubra TaxID=373956 RepID=A0AAN8XDJ4_HALRR